MTRWEILPGWAEPALTPLLCSQTSLCFNVQESCSVLKKLSMQHISLQFYPICYYYLNCIELWCLWIGNGRAKQRPPQTQCFRHSSASVSRADWDAAGSLPRSPSCFLPASLVLLGLKQTFWWKTEGAKMFMKAGHMQEHSLTQSAYGLVFLCIACANAQELLNSPWISVLLH